MILQSTPLFEGKQQKKPRPFEWTFTALSLQVYIIVVFLYCQFFGSKIEKSQCRTLNTIIEPKWEESLFYVLGVMR